MRKIYSISVLLLLLNLLACKATSSQIPNDDKFTSTELVIKEIKMQDGYFLIYANNLKNRNRYKIISCSNQVCNPNYNSKPSTKKIEIGKIYKLNLSWASEPEQENKVGNYMEFESCVTRYPLKRFCTETGYELYECNNLKGLDLVE